MAAGWLRKRIELQRKTKTRSATGQEEDGWTTAETVWGSLTPLKGAEKFAAQQAQSEVTGKTTIRWRSDVIGRPSQYRLKRGNRILDIVSAVDPTGRRKYVEIEWTEKTS